MCPTGYLCLSFLVPTKPCRPCFHLEDYKEEFGRPVWREMVVVLWTKLNKPKSWCSAQDLCHHWFQSQWSVRSQWSVARSQWSVARSQWSVVRSQWSVVRFQWSVVRSQWSVVRSQWSVGRSQWSIGRSQWSMYSWLHLRGCNSVAMAFVPEWVRPKLHT